MKRPECGNLECAAEPYLPLRLRKHFFQYDSRGNVTSTDDDSHSFGERALGTVSYDPNALNRLTHAEMPRTNGGKLDAAYDDAGNLILLQQSQNSCSDPAGACGYRFEYTWDEVGHSSLPIISGTHLRRVTRMFSRMVLMRRQIGRRRSKGFRIFPA